MIHIKDTKKVKLNSTERTAVALGKFDGIHQGHMLLIEQVLKLQRQGYMGVVFTFDMRENHVFDVSNMKTIYTSDEKAQLTSWLNIRLTMHLRLQSRRRSSEMF
mgnify:CR=1 FL=1